MVLTTARRNAFTRAAGTANDVRRDVEELEMMVEVDPRLADRVAELRVRLNYLTDMSRLNLDLDRAANPIR